MTAESIAKDLDGRRYPDISAYALLLMKRDADRYGTRGQWGVGPHHWELARLGLVKIGDPGAARIADQARGLPEVPGWLRPRLQEMLQGL